MLYNSLKVVESTIDFTEISKINLKDKTPKGLMGF